MRAVLAQLGEKADGVLVATKGGLERPGGDWTTNGRPEHLRAACERSLRAQLEEAETQLKEFSASQIYITYLKMLEIQAKHHARKRATPHVGLRQPTG